MQDKLNSYTLESKKTLLQIPSSSKNQNYWILTRILSLEVRKTSEDQKRLEKCIEGLLGSLEIYEGF
jgi:hypothetical protein